MAKDILTLGFEVQAKALREFGYPDVTAATIQAAHNDWKKGLPAKGVIAIFSIKEFDERPEIFGKRDA